MSKKSAFYLAFFVGLVALFYAVVQRWIIKKDTIAVVRPFAFVNQDGNVVTKKDVDGKVFVVEFFYTTCPGVCPAMNKNMKKVYDKFKDNPDFLILSHTSKPEEDSASALKKYAESLGVNTNKWIFLTGRKDSLYQMARLSYAIDDPANNLVTVKDDFIHSQLWALVDRDGKVKETFDGLKMKEVDDMIRKINRML